MMLTLENQDGAEREEFLVRTEGSEVLFVPIKEIPKARNFFILTTCSYYKVVDGKFKVYRTTGKLHMKHGETCQKLEGFTAKDLPALLEKVRDRILGHYMKAS